MSRPGSVYEVGKRLLDLVFAALGLLLAAPLMMLIAMVVRTRIGAPVFFTQVRPGRNGRLFNMIKFRTMTNETSATGELLPDADRLTPMGRMLRRTSLDELPELWNVLRGDMSIVGPRPLLPRYTPYFTDREKLRLTVRPGITGWAQINGRNNVSWDERLEMDAWYVENRSLVLDARIVVATMARVLRSTGVVEDPQSVMRDLDVERAGEG